MKLTLYLLLMMKFFTKSCCNQNLSPTICVSHQNLTNNILTISQWKNFSHCSELMSNIGEEISAIHVHINGTDSIKILDLSETTGNELGLSKITSLKVTNSK